MVSLCLEVRNQVFKLFKSKFQDDLTKGYQNFIACSKMAIWTSLYKEAICYIPPFDLYNDDSTNMRKCTNEIEGKDAMRKLQTIVSDFVANSEKFGCPLPCEKQSFSFTLNTLHNNSMLFEVPQNFTEDDIYILTSYYKTLLVEKEVETLVYDLSGFLAAAGGNMGLCLGLSCLSVLFTFTQWTKSFLQWVHQGKKGNLDKVRRT
jgi:hypothetical protein